MTTLLATDENKNPIQALRLKPGAAHQLNAVNTSSRNATPFNEATRIVSLYATGAVFIRFGDVTVAAAGTDHFFPAGVYYDFAIGGHDQIPQYTHLAVIRAATDCIVYVSEKE